MNQTLLALTLILGVVIYHLGPWGTEHHGPIGVDSNRVIIDVGVSNWTSEIVGSLRPVLVFFHSPNSRKCQQLYPILSDANEMLQGRVKFTRIELAKNASVAMPYEIGQTPSLVMFKDGLKLDTLDEASVRDFTTLEERLLAYCD